MSFNPDHSPWCVLSARPFDEGLTEVEKSIKDYASLQIRMYRREMWEQVVDRVIKEVMVAGIKEVMLADIKAARVAGIKPYREPGIKKLPIPKSSKKRAKITKKIRTAVIETARSVCDRNDAGYEISSVDDGERAKTLLKMFRSTFCAYRRRCPDWEEGKLFDVAEEFVVRVEGDYRSFTEWEQSQKVD